MAISATLDQVDLLVIYGKFHSKTADSSARRTFFSIEGILNHKTRLVRFKNIEIISIIFSDYNGIKLGINYRNKTEKIS